MGQHTKIVNASGLVNTLVNYINLCLQVPMADELLSMMPQSQSVSPCVIHTSDDSNLSERKMTLTMAYKQPTLMAARHYCQVVTHT